jgi:hypothetical protein
VERVKFASGDQRLVTAHADGTVRIWRCHACRPIGEVRAMAATLANRSLSREERNTFLGEPV